MKLIKNKIILVVLGLLLGVTSVAAGVTISLVYNKTVEGMEAYNASRMQGGYTSLEDVGETINVIGLEDKYGYYVEQGIIVFE